MELTKGQQFALETFLSGENILLLGDPGTGKSALISTIIEAAESDGKIVAITASTGIAAQLIGGRTIHSFLRAFPGMAIKKINYESKIDNLSKIDVLIIDEISMLGCKFIEYLYNCLKHVQHHIQLVLVGDFFQLPPVKDGYAFKSLSWQLLRLVPCVLTEVVRQNDAEFVRNINLLKNGDPSCLDYLISHSSPVPLMGQISICATRSDAQLINNIEMEKLSGTPQLYSAEHEGTVFESELRTEECLVIKNGMRVMSVINSSRYSNGSLGTVIDHDSSSVNVLFDNGNDVKLGKELFTVDRKDIIGETTVLKQIPLRPAYAITIHKSQGQTFQNVNIDGTRCWAPGQLYVAVSRARSIEGIHFLTPIRNGNIKTDPAVARYYQSIGFSE